MADDNISEFNAQVLRVIAALYAAHPRLFQLDEAVTLGRSLNQTDADFDDASTSSAGTIQWLYRNGVVTGNLQMPDGRAFMMDAQLSSKAFRILQKTEGAVGPKHFGGAIVDAAPDPTSHNGKVIAELLVRRLSE